MKILNFLRDFAIAFVITFIVTIIVSYIYSLVTHGEGAIGWPTAFQLAVIFGVVFPTIRIIEDLQEGQIIE